MTRYSDRCLYYCRGMVCYHLITIYGLVYTMYNILLVEDDIVLRQKLKKILLAAFPALSILDASSEAECLKKISDNQVIIILMDIRLQAENGIKLTKKIKTSFPHIFVAIHSICDSQEYRRIARQVGADYFLSKKSNSINDMIALLKKNLEHILHNCKSRNT